jgi:hypothetical protein
MRDIQGSVGPSKNHIPLAVRGSSPRTFRSLGLFAEAGLLFCGGYLLAEPILSPLSAGAASIVGGGLFLALATVLLFYLLWPSYANVVSRQELVRNAHEEALAKGSANMQRQSADAQWKLENEDELPGPM